MATDVKWDIRLEGRAWGEEAMQRFELTPEKFEMYQGKLFWSDEGRVNLLGLPLEKEVPWSGCKTRSVADGHRHPGRGRRVAGRISRSDPMFTPFNWNWTPTTSRSSTAVAVRSTVPASVVLPFTPGENSETIGGPMSASVFG